MQTMCRESVEAARSEVCGNTRKMLGIPVPGRGEFPAQQFQFKFYMHL